MKYSTYPWIWRRHLSQHPMPPGRHDQHLLIPSAQTNSLKKTKNPGLREVDLEPSPKRGSNKINILKSGRKTAEENKSYRTAWTHTWIPALREVDLEPSAKRGANRTKALVSFY